MIVDRDGNITIITQEKGLIDFIQNLETSYQKFEKDHLIINLTGFGQLSLEDILGFLLLSNKHRNNKKSFVIVTEKVDLDQMPDEIIVVPTRHEAYDIIEMEDIERDLGF